MGGPWIPAIGPAKRAGGSQESWAGGAGREENKSELLLGRGTPPSPAGRGKQAQRSSRRSMNRLLRQPHTGSFVHGLAPSAGALRAEPESGVGRVSLCPVSKQRRHPRDSGPGTLPPEEDPGSAGRRGDGVSSDQEFRAADILGLGMAGKRTAVCSEGASGKY
ncbi:hypothetical protein KIL84_015764 [Mauremys mutica]|uniref:Uncharacterized protein n=1 Tax=Mauremys mutica TaxID=74926 RepID=A0A9D3WSY7_9SAUR|nr:hypothetical protein KIL84_015764 [Mauremys mutica]